MIDKTLITCFANGKRCNDSNIKRTTRLDQNDNCLVIDSTEKIDLPGPTQGLFIQMHVGKKVTEESKTQKSFEDVLLFVDEPNIRPDTLHGISIPRSQSTRIALSKTNEIQLSEPYSRCKQLKSINDYHSDLYKSTFNDYGSYSQV